MQSHSKTRDGFTSSSCVLTARTGVHISARGNPCGAGLLLSTERLHVESQIAGLHAGRLASMISMRNRSRRDDLSFGCVLTENCVGLVGWVRCYQVRRSACQILQVSDTLTREMSIGRRFLLSWISQPSRQLDIRQPRTYLPRL